MKIKIVTLIFGSQNRVFLKCTFSGPQLSWRGLVWFLLNSWKARAPRGRPARARASRGLGNCFDEKGHSSVLVLWVLDNKNMHKLLGIYQTKNVLLKFDTHDLVIWLFEFAAVLSKIPYFCGDKKNGGLPSKVNLLFTFWYFFLNVF